VCGLHFFNPAPVMRLVEIVRTASSATETLATTFAIAKRIGKLPIVTGVCDGFVVNRMLARRSREAAFMLEEGATPTQIDRVLYEFGFPMGPYALSDLAGIDLQYAARSARRERLTERERAADFVDQLHALKRYGQKTGAGWYRYDENRKALPDPEIDALLAAHSAKRGLTRRTFGDDEILERCLYGMVNEGARLIAEGIVPRPDEVDVAMINGIGFPAHTGGPLWWADSVGLDKVVAAMRRYFVHDRGDWTPAPLLERLAASGGRFYG
jgi:3-hydroxyacyl-CoA dehydrogenase